MGSKRKKEYVTRNLSKYVCNWPQGVNQFPVASAQGVAYGLEQFTCDPDFFGGLL